MPSVWVPGRCGCVARFEKSQSRADRMFVSGGGGSSPRTGGQRADPRALDGRLEGKVEVLQCLAGRQVGQLQRSLHAPRLAAGQLRLKQDVEEGIGRDLLAHMRSSTKSY